MSVYVIQAGAGGPCKIGIAGDARKRIADLQTAHHTKLRILHIWDGGRETETWLHDRLAQHRIHGEWFEPVDALVSGDIIHAFTAQPEPDVPLNPRFRSLVYSPAQVREMAVRSGKTMLAVCLEAGVAQSTFTRWQAGTTAPRLDVYCRLVEAAMTPATHENGEPDCNPLAVTEPTDLRTLFPHSPLLAAVPQHKEQPT